MVNLPQAPRPEKSAPRSDAIPVAPSLQPAVQLIGSTGITGGSGVDRRTVWITLIACLIGFAAALVAQALGKCIFFITNLAFFGSFSFAESSPADNQLGLWVIGVPVVGALIIGVMARYGSSAIRGHGIPEAMEQVLFNQSRIPARVLFLKPLSAVISIGSGGPFGAEGPIIATGAALGSLVGQYTKISADERKTLLAAGAAAGMSATFGSPVAAVLLAIELLLFEYRSRSLIPVVLAATTAAAARLAFEGTAPAFQVSDLPEPSGISLVGYVMIGVVCGIASMIVTKAVYWLEDGFERLPIHWMWWPALGAIPVGVIGVFAPHTMGVGYDNIEKIVSGDLTGSAIAVLCVWKFVSWLFALSSGTSGGTLAPLLTIGGGLGAGCAALLVVVAPGLGVDVRIGALVGMAALFAGASRALLASVVFAFEATRQPLGLLPLLGGCGAAYLLSGLLMRTSIMTEKIARRGRPVPSDYGVDHLERVLVKDVALREVVTLQAEMLVKAGLEWLREGGPKTAHHGYPVVDREQRLLGVLTQRDLLLALVPNAPLSSLIRRPAVGIPSDSTLREAGDAMLDEDVGRLPVLDNGRLVGIVTRSDLLESHRSRLDSTSQRKRTRRFKRPPS